MQTHRQQTTDRESMREGEQHRVLLTEPCTLLSNSRRRHWLKLQNRRKSKNRRRRQKRVQPTRQRRRRRQQRTVDKMRDSVECV